MKRWATAVWKGSGKEGKGTVSVQSGLLKDQPYTWASRFEQGAGTNPEELVAAAHAGCFAMKLSFVLGNAGFTPESLNVTCTVNLDQGAITESHLELKAKVPGISPEKFAECANEAKANCPISKSLTAKITLDAQLEA
jgi:osmotically inducible protein OsmC